jgi:rhodanese-related sulfurtransferase
MTIASGSIWHSFLKQDHSAIVLDVRSESECLSGILFGAIRLDSSDTLTFNKRVNSFDREKHYYIYSQTGKKGEKVCEIMEQMGFKETINLEGGLNNLLLKFTLNTVK